MVQEGVRGDVNQKFIQILMVEDNESDAAISVRTLKQYMLPHEIHVVSDGLEALNYLYNKSPFDNPDKYPTPDLMMIDLNMPHIDGHELLKKIKADKQFHSIPVLILSSSQQDEDIKRSIDQGAVTYVHKSLGDEDLRTIVQMFNEYWKLKTQR
ncbi:MAG: response regulator [Candidatus Omnitrophica bacterium]|nr:response regulator [Candidatus Omnitrophota bacterium]